MVNHDIEKFITIPVTIMATIFTAANALITYYLIRSFFSSQKQSKNIAVTGSAVTAPVKISKYFKYTASITVVFNTLNAFFNALSCLYLIYDPQHDDGHFYIYHSSHLLRIVSTVCWYVAKVSLIYVITGRLYKSFYGTALMVKKRPIIYINIINTIIAPVGLLCGYYGVFTGNLILAEIGLNLIGRVLYEVISFTILFMFSQRLLTLSVQNSSVSHVSRSSMVIITATGSTVSSKASSAPNSNKTAPAPVHVTPSPIQPALENNVSLSVSLVDHDHDQEKNKQMSTPNICTDSGTETKKSTQPKVHINKKDCFLAITTRNAILMLTISFFVLVVSFCFYGFRFIFGPQTRLTLLIPMNMAAFDGLVTSVCVYCMFMVGNTLYDILCGSCDKKCKHICLKVAQKTLIS